MSQSDSPVEFRHTGDAVFRSACRVGEAICAWETNLLKLTGADPNRQKAASCEQPSKPSFYFLFALRSQFARARRYHPGSSAHLDSENQFTNIAGCYGFRMSPVVWEVAMSITPLEKQQVSGSAVAVYEGLEKRGKVINFFKVLAYKPEILKTFLDFYQEVWREGKLPAVTKELAYLRTSILNGCAY